MTIEKNMSAAITQFADLGLPDHLVKMVSELGYEVPSPIQEKTMPHLLAGDDLVGQAQTGTGKTAAFALPILARLPSQGGFPRALVLTPTRELAIQVSEAFARYGAGLGDFRVLPIYGGQPFGGQLNGLKRGAHVVVGTPGRIIDHLKRGTLDLSQLSTLVLDEADEMLKMGFVEDVEAVLASAPTETQIALFSATMPPLIRAMAKRYLKHPHHITIESKTTTAASINQRYWIVSGLHKLDALTRLLEVEPFDAMIVFARTKIATEELAHRLRARGFSAQALNGDIPQKKREQLIDALKTGQIDLLVATDVAARGLDVERISHVVNYDIPHDTEAYVHRIGRTGRAGRSGEAILFVAPRERYLLRAIEKATRQPLTEMEMPTVADVNAHRDERQYQQLLKVLESEDLTQHQEKILNWQKKAEASLLEVASALALMAEEPSAPPTQATRAGSTSEPSRASSAESHDDTDKQTYWVAVGHQHGVKPGNLVGAIANEGGLSSGQIGRVAIKDRFSLVDLPKDLSPEIIRHLRQVKVAGSELNIRPDRGPMDSDSQPPSRRKPRAPEKPRTKTPTKPYKKAATDRPRGKKSTLSRAERKAGHQRRTSVAERPAVKSSSKPKK
jgi:ATP-dependent RNA helicase DeaD